MIELNLAFFAQVINFGILALVLNCFLYRPIRKVLAARRGIINDARETAASADLEVQEKMALYEAKLRDAKADAAAKRAESLKAAQAEEAGLLEKARSEASTSLDGVRNRIAKETADARILLRQQAEALSTDIAEKLLGRSL